MMDANSVGRLTTLSPVTWTDGWPYFGLPGNLGRSPRIWVKPRTAVTQEPTAPYRRSDDFSGRTLQPIWQWNHVPVDGRWSLTERAGHLRLHALAATSLLDARNTLTQRSIGPRSTPTVVLDVSGMKPGDRAGLALFYRPYAWIGVEAGAEGSRLAQVTEGAAETPRVPLRTRRIWLRADCDFLTEEARFSYSTDGTRFEPLGPPFRMVFQLLTFQGVRYALFSFNTATGGGFADFDSIDVHEPNPRALTKPIPYGDRITLNAHDSGAKRWIARGHTLRAAGGESTNFEVIDRQLGRVALRADGRFVSVGRDGRLWLDAERAGEAETFQWIETFTGELVLLSLATHRYVRLEPATSGLVADSPGPHPNRRDGVRWEWQVAASRGAAASIRVNGEAGGR
jgi:hypothetical protein